MNIYSKFDGGAIEVVGGDARTGHLQVNIRKDFTTDPDCNFRQWFFFRVQGAQNRSLRIDFLNAAQTTYPRGWQGYRVCASYDCIDWFRIPTSFDGGVMSVTHVPERETLFLAYFEPYSRERHLALLAEAQRSPLARISVLGKTIDANDLHLVTIGEPAADRKNVWVIARQHPGETMAEWFVEGLLQRLLDAADPVACRALERAVFRIVPNMNPDGSERGNLRSNAAGANLNREWLEPSMERSPEVFQVRREMHTTGVDLFLDVHGDENLPYIFVAGCEMLPGFTVADAARQKEFSEQLKRASPDFQDVHGYSPDKYHADALKLASKYVGHTFGCLSLTLEMPFKDNANLPDERVGWNGGRSRKLGAAVLQPILGALT
jgi:murein tripeptide amidase MpaA